MTASLISHQRVFAFCGLSQMCCADKKVCVRVCLHSGDVPGGDRGDPGCDRAVSVHPDPGASLQTDRSLYLQPSLPGKHHASTYSHPYWKMKISPVTRMLKQRISGMTDPDSLLSPLEHRKTPVESSVCVFVAGSGASSLLLEQWVHPKSDRGELSSHSAAGIRHPLQSLQGTLEPVSGSRNNTNT